SARAPVQLPPRGCQAPPACSSMHTPGARQQLATHCSRRVRGYPESAHKRGLSMKRSLSLAIGAIVTILAFASADAQPAQPPTSVADAASRQPSTSQGRLTPAPKATPWRAPLAVAARQRTSPIRTAHPGLRGAAAPADWLAAASIYDVV